MSPEARLAVILAADVTGYSRLIGADSRARTNASTRISARPDDQAFPIYRMGHCVQQLGEALLLRARRARSHGGEGAAHGARWVTDYAFGPHTGGNDEPVIVQLREWSRMEDRKSRATVTQKR
jgi:hypothetical protein